MAAIYAGSMRQKMTVDYGIVSSWLQQIKQARPGFDRALGGINGNGGESDVFWFWTGRIYYYSAGM